MGQYEVVGRIAVGGMAEILLARLLGPRGFERPMVIKRILPHLAERPQFLSMMTDEARIAARIQHPNVVRIHELIEHDGMPHIVMEYLSGESFAQLLSDVHESGEGLQLALACHIVAEAAAGLHAAHELRSHDGTPLEVIHRDVSPHNIFVTDEGGVKVVDFGIVKAAARLTRTATGQLKGKYRYFAPEQCDGSELDRRVDLWALGVCLYEATTGHRLFERANELLTLRAIANEPVLPPSTFVPDYPPKLERLVMKALARDPKDRFATADEFRQALVTFTLSITGPVLPDRGVRGLMQRVFKDRIAMRQEMLRRLGDDDPMDLKLVDHQEMLDRTRSGVVRRSSSPAPKRRVWVAPAAVLGVGALIGAGWMLGRQNNAEAAPPAPAPAVAAPPTAAVAPAPEDVQVAILTTPPGADVRLGGILLGRTPLHHRFARSGGAQRVSLSLDGYRSRDIDVIPDVDQRLSIELVQGQVAREPRQEQAAALPEEPPAVRRSVGARPTTTPPTSAEQESPEDERPSTPMAAQRELPTGVSMAGRRPTETHQATTPSAPIGRDTPTSSMGATPPVPMSETRPREAPEPRERPSSMGSDTLDPRSDPDFSIRFR